VARAALGCTLGFRNTLILKFALVQGEKKEALPKLRGICACCGTETVAKCGRYTVWHWAHLSKEHCDPWWENETEWHRTWKNCFPVECQEVIHWDSKSGEKHVADVKTRNNMIIEFQHSTISQAEVAERESFYGRMIWVINGNRPGNFDNVNFSVSIGNGATVTERRNTNFVRFHWYSRSKLFDRWSTSTVPVFFDFGGPNLWWLKRFDSSTREVFMQVTKKADLIEKNGGTFSEKEPGSITNPENGLTFG
jgi:competence protein CoiA